MNTLTVTKTDLRVVINGYNRYALCSSVGLYPVELCLSIPKCYPHLKF